MTPPAENANGDTRATQAKGAGASELGWELATLLVVAGALLYRSSQLGRTFWADELWVRLGLEGVGRFAAPVPFVFELASRAALWLGAGSEMAMRLPAYGFFAATALLPLWIAWSAPRALSLAAAWSWTTLISLSSPIGFYATQLKPYTMDVFASCLLLGELLVWGDRRERRYATARFFSVALLVALVSIPGVFVALPALIAVGLVRAKSAGDRSQRLRVLGTAAATSLAVVAFAAYRRHAFDVSGPELEAALQRWWEPRFWDGSMDFAYQQSRHWLGQALNLLPGGLPILAAASIWWWREGSRGRRDRAVVAIATGLPPFLALAASALHLYPYGEVRLMLFAFPGLYLVLALGIGSLPWRRVGATLALPVVFFLVYAFRGAVIDTYNRSYMRLHDGRQMYRVADNLVRPGDLVVAPAGLAPELNYYLPRLVGRVRDSWVCGEAVNQLTHGALLAIERVDQPPGPCRSMLPKANPRLEIDGFLISRFEVSKPKGAS